MTIDLIAKNQVAEYIQQNPEAYSYLMTWIKESKYRNGRRSLNAQSTDGTVTGLIQLGASKYTLKYMVNIELKTALILFLGTREEEMALHEAEMQKYMADHPEEKLVTVTKTFSVSIKAPPIPNTITSPKTIQSVSDNEEMIFPNNINNDDPHQTREDYEKNLQRAIDIFKSPSGTDEFNELAVLLPLIKNYESRNIKLPEFNMLAAFKLRMKDFRLTPKDLIYNIGNEEDVALFLSGKKIPSNTILKKVYNMVALKIPVNRNDFIIK